MSKDINKTIQEAEEAIASLEKVAHTKLDDVEQKMKKGIVQTVIWILITVAIYFIWGATWFFWLSLAFNVVSIAGIVFTKVVMAKAYKKISKSDESDDVEFDSDFEDNDEEIEYDQKQKALEILLNMLEEIGDEHDEIYDTDCRDQMREAVCNGFIFEKENYVLPNTFGLYTEEGNKAVKDALSTYINLMLILAKDASAKERLEMFQDEVYSNDAASPDEFFGWVDVDDLERMR